MIAILQHFIPDMHLELEGLKTIGAQLGIQGPSSSGLPPQQPMRSLPASLEGQYPPRSTSTPVHSEGLSERSPSPGSELEKEDDMHAAESLLNMTDTPSQRSTPSEIRKYTRLWELRNRRDSCSSIACDFPIITIPASATAPVSAA